MPSHAKQHFVPRSYLKAWCDPATSAHLKRHVWRFNKDGSNPRRVPPKKLFYETDLYTIHSPDGGRDLTLERGLASLESEFVTIRDRTLAQRKQATPDERVWLCAFIAAAQARTPMQRDHLGQQWGQVLEQMDSMIEWAREATPEQVAEARSLGEGSGPTFSYEDVKLMVSKPMETWLVPLIEEMTPLLVGLDFAVVECDRRQAFITSDNPCVWFDPDWHTRPPMYQAPGLAHPGIQITLPVSPRQLVMLNRLGKSGYFRANERVTDDFNRRTRFYCSEYFVVNANATKAIWFDPGQEPEDSWRKQHPGS